MGSVQIPPSKPVISPDIVYGKVGAWSCALSDGNFVTFNVTLRSSAALESNCYQFTLLVRWERHSQGAEGEERRE